MCTAPPSSWVIKETSWIMKGIESLAERFRRENDELRREDQEIQLADERKDIDNEIANNPVEAVPAKIASVDYRALENATKHHCERYELLERRKDVSVIRRGGNFMVTVIFNKEVDLEKGHLLKINMSFGPSPSTRNGTQAVLAISGNTNFDKKPDYWDVRVHEQDGKSITLEIQVPPHAPVGVWESAFEISDRSDSDRTSRHFKTDHLTYILFNPWNKEDQTYLAEEDKRQEYVLNDNGTLWQEYNGRPWVFGQFDDVVLPACELILEKSKISPKNRWDPVLVTRAISRLVNSNDKDQGVLEGRWKGEYWDGVAPTSWSGSIDILEQYIRTRKPVKYGQCWVFAGVVNTICRALGLPARPVTNISSGHDSDGSLTIDSYFNEEGENVGNAEDIWNYHVWNEVWMARPDLPWGFGGWQVIDATPQELSQGKMQCGPASLEAIRQVQTHFNYDVPFVLAEVNADVVHWLVTKRAPDEYKMLWSNKTRVGKRVLTKALGNSDVEDITHQYKPQERSLSERITLHAAASRCNAAKDAFKISSKAVKDVEFEIGDFERVPIGEDFTVTIMMKNVSGERRTVSALMTVASVYYTGVKAHAIARRAEEFTLDPDEKKTLFLLVKYDTYYPLLVEHSLMKITSICNVKETSYSWFGEDKFQMIKPKMMVKCPTEAKVNKPLDIQFSFKNTLSTTLTNCMLVIDAPSLVRPKTISLSNVGPKANFTCKMKLYPKKQANCTIVGIFNSKELLDVTGSTKAKILPSDG